MESKKQLIEQIRVLTDRNARFQAELAERRSPLQAGLEQLTERAAVSGALDPGIRAEAEFRPSGFAFDSLAESSPDIVVRIDGNLRLVYANPALHNLSGLAPSEIVAQGLYALCDNNPVLRDFVCSVENTCKQVIATGTEQISEFSCTTADGIKHFQGRFVPELSGEGTVGMVTMISRDISTLKRAQEELQKANQLLESRVKMRTAELEGANLILRAEIAQRKKLEEELELKTNRLQEVNAALKTLLRQRDEDRKDFEEAFLTNIENLIRPYLSKIKAGHLTSTQASLIDIVDSHLNELTSQFGRTLALRYRILTPTEMRVAALVRDGKTSKEIADILCISEKTASFHRNNIRAKLGLRGEGANLRSYLLSLI